MITIHQLNKMSHSESVDLLKDIFEQAAWVAERAAKRRPFTSLKDLHEHMVQVVEEAGMGEKLALIMSHPNLGSRLEMTAYSTNEQNQAGLDQLSKEEYDNFLALNYDYMNTFHFPFIMAVRGSTKDEIYSAMTKRIHNSPEIECKQALSEIYKIALFRLQDLILQKGEISMKNNQQERTMSYGKSDVFAYRTYLKPLTGVTSIPESSFSGRDNIVFGINVTMEVTGEAFLPSFTEGDNQSVVATDSMKNFIQRHLASYEGSTIEGFLAYTAESFLLKYPQVESVKLIGEEIPFKTRMGESPDKELVFKRSRNECAQATIEMISTDDGTEMINQSSGINDLQLIKISGNSFVGFVQDEYTTLPEDSNRPLFVYLDIDWNYEKLEDSFGDIPKNYVAAEQIRDLASQVFHETETSSIQNLIYHIGYRVLERFPQLSAVTFQSQNRTWETVVEDIPDTHGKVYTEPRLPYGFQTFSLTREDIHYEEATPVLKNSYQ